MKQEKKIFSTTQHSISFSFSYGILKEHSQCVNVSLAHSNTWSNCPATAILEGVKFNSTYCLQMECASVLNNADWLGLAIMLACSSGTLLAPRSCIAAVKMCADVVRCRKFSHAFMSLLRSVMTFLLFMRFLI